MDQKIPVAIVGAGMIADTHLQVLKSLPHVHIKAICDISLDKAQSMAKKYGVEKAFGSLEEFIKDRPAETVHVLVPPDLHLPVTLSLLEAKFHVFLEKPIAVNSQECQQLLQAAENNKVKLYINHNYAFHPTHLECKKILESGILGKIHHLIMHWNMPLRQIAAQQFGHWMFQKPGNILLEQFVHPLSQVYDLLGNINTVDCVVLGKKKIAPGYIFFDTWNACLSCEKASAEMFFSVGQSYPTHAMTLICDDGQIHADFTLNTYTVQRKTPWMDFIDRYFQSRGIVSQLKKQNSRNLWDFALSTLRFKDRTDIFYLSMKNSIQAFYEGKEEKLKTLESKAGTRLVEICQIMAESVKTQEEISSPKLSLYNPEKKEKFDALVIGGTGFIGTRLINKMVESGAKVLVAARNIKTLPEIFYHEKVTVVSANITDEKKIRQITEGIPLVIHLAHGGSANSWEDVEKNMIQGTKNIAQACLEHKVHKLLYIGTIASLYLGDEKEKITGKTPLDKQIDSRGLYSKGKAKCEDLLMELHNTHHLPVCILRPGVVVGEAGTAMHSGLGLFNQDAYCLGWNKGNNPLPLVLVEDVASAICLAAASEQVIGKAYNIVGDVRLNAREYIAELGKALGRKLCFVPQSLIKIQSIEIFKWLIKVIFQRKNVSFPSLRDLKSRGMVANFHCQDLKEDIGWQPESNKDIFIEKGIKIYAR